MIIGNEFHSIISKIFDDDVKGIGESEQLQANCPKCQQRDGLYFPDGKYNLEINTKKRLFRCWKCDQPKFSGSLGRLIRMYGSDSDYELYTSHASTIFDYSLKDDEKVFERVKLPNEFISFTLFNENDPQHLEAYKYMVLDRKIDYSTLKKFNIGFCTRGKYWGRIIIPSYDREGEINYFVSRGYKGQKIPYLNPKTNKDLIIFNEGIVNWDSTIYIVEGVFEFLTIPFNTIPLLGKSMSSVLIEKLKYKKPEIIIILDADAFYNTIKIYRELSLIYGDENNHKIKFVKLENNYDLDEIRREFGKEKVVEIIKNARQLVLEDYFIEDKFYNEKKYY